MRRIVEVPNRSLIASIDAPGFISTRTSPRRKSSIPVCACAVEAKSVVKSNKLSTNAILLNQRERLGFLDIINILLYRVRLQGPIVVPDPRLSVLGVLRGSYSPTIKKPQRVRRTLRTAVRKHI